MGKLRQETCCKTGDRRRETRDERQDKGIRRGFSALIENNRRTFTNSKEEEDFTETLC